MADAKTEKKRLVCTGLARVKGKSKPLPDFAELNADGTVVEGATYCWDKVRGTVGHVYEVEVVKWDDTGKVILPSSARWVAVYQDTDKRLQWEAAADVLRANADRERMRKLAEKKTALRETIAPLAMAYRKLFLPDDRRAFLAMVVAEISNPRNAKEDED